MQNDKDNNNIFVSVITPTFNRANSLKRTIDSIVNQTYSHEQYEILIVDNGSTDTTRDVVNSSIKAFPYHNIRYLFESTPGSLAARHRGALEAKGDIFVFIDDDILTDPKWLESICQTFNNDMEVQLVGGRNLPRYESKPPEWIDLFWTDLPCGRMCIELSLLDLGKKVRVVDANYVWTLNFAIRKKAFFDLGGFHPDYMPKQLQHFQGDGETGLTMKANELGYKAIYQPKALIYHNIPPGRMTYEYFDARYFFQGVCNSFTEFRSQHGLYKPNALQSSDMRVTGSYIEKAKKNLRDIARQFNKNDYTKYLEQALRERFHTVFLDGYRFHQEAVKKNPDLLEWVIRDNYLDYTLPDIAPDKTELQKEPMADAPEFIGNYSSWNEVMAHCVEDRGGNSLEGLKDAYLKVINGEAVYQRDSVLFDKIQYSWPLLSGLLWVASLNDNRLNVLDFGGSLGASYYQNRNFLKNLKALTWNIVEVEGVVRCGKESFENEVLKFYSSIEECLKKGSNPDVVIISGVLQYIEKPYELLKNIFDFGFNYILLDRTPFSLDRIEYIKLQKASPGVDTAGWAHWFFALEEFRLFLSSRYELIEEFDSSIVSADFPSGYKGFILRRFDE